MPTGFFLFMIYIARDGAQQGPFSMEHLNSMLAIGQLKPTDLSWWEGCKEWVPVMTAPGAVIPAAQAAVPVPVVAGPAAGVAAPQPSAPASVYAPPQGSLAPVGGHAQQVSPAAVLALRQTRPWVLFLAILGIIFTALMLLGGLSVFAFGAFGAMKTGSRGAAEIGLIAGMGIFYLVFALLYLYPIIKLFKYAGAISRLSQSSASADLEEALCQQRSFWRFVGILTLVMVILYAVALLFVGLGAFTSFSGLGSPSPGGLPAAPSGTP